MCTHCLLVAPTPSLNVLHARFLTILPRIERHGRVYFRGVKCPHKRADRIADMIALAWKWFRMLAQKGKDATHFPTALAAYAARAVQSGRRATGRENTRDVLSPLTQQRRHFVVNTLPAYETLSSNPFSEALADNTQSPIPEQVAFRCDFPVWLASLGTRNRHIAEDMARGHKTRDLAKIYGISQGRISQMRREFHMDWRRFTGDLPAPTPARACIA